MNNIGRGVQPATTAQGDEVAIPDLVCRDFTADAPGQKLVGDITYIPTWEGWCVPGHRDRLLFQAVIGWSMSDSLHTDIVCAAIDAAANYIDLQPGCISTPTVGRRAHRASSASI
jgi:transposase InsO family protein